MCMLSRNERSLLQICAPRGKGGRDSRNFRTGMACRNESRHDKEKQRMALIILGLSFTQSQVGVHASPKESADIAQVSELGSILTLDISLDSLCDFDGYSAPSVMLMAPNLYILLQFPSFRPMYLTAFWNPKLSVP